MTAYSNIMIREKKILSKFKVTIFIIFMLLCIFFHRSQGQKNPVLYPTDSLLSLFGEKVFSTYNGIFKDDTAKAIFQLHVTKGDTSRFNRENNYLIYVKYVRDSVLNVLRNSNDNIEKADCYATMAFENPYDSVNYFYNQARNLMVNMDIKSSVSNRIYPTPTKLSVNRRFALCFEKSGNYIEMIKLINENFKICEQLNDSGYYFADELFCFIPFLYEFEPNDLSLYVDKYINLKKGQDKERQLYMLFYSLGATANGLGKFIDAKKYLWKSYEYKLMYPQEMRNLQFNNLKLSDVCFKLQEYDSSVYYLRKNITNDYVDKNLMKMENSAVFKRMGFCYRQMGQPDSAFYYFQLSVESYKEFDNLFYLAQSAFKLKKFGYFERLVTEAMNLQRKLRKPIFHEPDSLEVAELASDYYILKGDYKKALEYYKLFVPKNLSKTYNLQRIENQKMAAYNQYKYQQQKVQHELEERVRQEKQRRNELKNITIYAGTGGAGLLLLMALFSVRNKRKREVAELSEQVSSTEMKALRSQMNPHFIFNALQSIQNFLLNHQSENANEYLLKFSRLMRLVLENSLHSEVPLKDDLDALELYIQLESLRFTHPVKYSITIDESIDPELVTIPPLLLQPFVENAFWHGLQYKSDEGSINIRIEKKDRAILCIVEDNGVGRSYIRELKGAEPERKSLGMALTLERIELFNKMHGTHTEFTILDLFNENSKPAGTRIELLVPVIP